MPGKKRSSGYQGWRISKTDQSFPLGNSDTGLSVQSDSSFSSLESRWLTFSFFGLVWVFVLFYQWLLETKGNRSLKHLMLILIIVLKKNFRENIRNFFFVYLRPYFLFGEVDGLVTT